MQKELIEKFIADACNLLYEHQKHLIYEKSNERNAVGHLAGYLRGFIQGWDIDTDYNREGIDRVPKRDADNNLTNPDIIIHQHGPEGENLVAVEVKGYWNHASRADDEQKLKSLQAKHKYKYLYRIELAASEAILIEII